MRNRYVGLLILLGGVMALLLIRCPGKPKEQPAGPPQPDPVNSITYSVEIFREGDSSISPFERTVYFDRRRSCTSEPQAGCGVYYTLRGGGETETVVMQFPWLTVFYGQSPVSPVSPIKGVVRLTGDTKTILGLRCRKAVTTGDGVTQTIWFAPDLHANDPTQAVMQDSLVPGLILELGTKYGPAMGNYHVHYTVTDRSVDSVADRTVFEVPRHARRAADGEEAIALVAERLAELQNIAAVPDEEKDRFLGKWQLTGSSRRIEWHIERFGAATYTLTETRMTGGKRRRMNRGILSFYEGKLVVREGAVFRLFALTANDELQQVNDPLLTFRRQ